MGGASGFWAFAGEAKVGLDEKSRDKLAKLVGMLASASDGEVVNAARMITRTLKAHGSDINDLVTIVRGEPAAARDSGADAVRRKNAQDLRNMAVQILHRPNVSSQTTTLVRHMIALIDNGRTPTPAQIAWLIEVWRRS